MSDGDFKTYFHERAGRFSSFYRSEPVSRLLGRGPLFDRLRFAVVTAEALGAKRALDVGCGSGPLFGPLASVGIHVTGIDPADGMVALARKSAEAYPDMVDVEQRGWEQIDEVGAYDIAIALGVFDYVAEPAELLDKMGRAATHVVASFPYPGLRTDLRKARYGARGVGVHGYPPDGFDALATAAGMRVALLTPLGSAGAIVHFTQADGGERPTD
jgi:SAM-dependent methyltransferase